MFDNISKDDLIVAFFPCIYFTGSTNPRYFTLENLNYKNFSTKQKIDYMLDRADKRNFFHEKLLKLVGVVIEKDLRMIFENPYSSLHYLHNNFFKEPDILDSDRTMRGDFFKKPTGYWFFNCQPTNGETIQPTDPQKVKRIFDLKKHPVAGMCSEERSIISKDYARNWICDFVIGKKQEIGQLSLF